MRRGPIQESHIRYPPVRTWGIRPPMVAPDGIEPSTSAYETDVKPFHYDALVPSVRIELTQLIERQVYNLHRVHSGLQRPTGATRADRTLPTGFTSPCANHYTSVALALLAGFEPASFSLTGSRSTIELQEIGRGRTNRTFLPCFQGTDNSRYKIPRWSGDVSLAIHTPHGGSCGN